ncbi:MAG: SufD family Fe-S cluster assembly protein [Treponemataceae bacterium]|nr:SufD family Fe-S cluster assembly protein [Treponemataceae bacterium]
MTIPTTVTTPKYIRRSVSESREILHIEAHQEQELILQQDEQSPCHIEIRLCQGARLRVVLFSLQRDADDTTFSFRNLENQDSSPIIENEPAHYFYRFILEEGAQLFLTEAIFHTKETHYHTVIELGGAGSTVDVGGMYGAWGTAKGSHHYTIHHQAPYTTSNSSFRSAVTGRGSLVFHDRIHIAPEAPKSDGFLSIRNLILNDGAHAEAYPELEIENNDVSCSHGATTGGIDPLQAYYLQSRGISPEESRAFLLMAHLAPIFQRLPESYQHQCKTIILNQLAYQKEHKE